jgi:Amt family ammonium transporter
VAYALAIAGSFVLYQLVHAFMETRADEAEELTGLDIIEHGERGYTRGVPTSSPLLGSFETSSEMLANTVMQMNMEKG